jgi:fatty aldehyde-generating acyl-ACP reductase
MSKFALVVHPTDMELLRGYLRRLGPGKRLDDRLWLKLFEWAPSHQVMEWTGYSLDGSRRLGGIMIMVPFLPEMKDIKLRSVQSKIDAALHIAAAEGCTVAALGAFASIAVQGQEATLSARHGLRITSGNALTAALIVQSIEDLARRFRIELAAASLAILGASGDIGSACAAYFGDKVRTLHLSARGRQALARVVEHNRDRLACPVKLHDDNASAIGNADVVVLATSASSTILSNGDFRPGTIVCDASAPANVRVDRQRVDIFVYHGGVALLREPLDLPFATGLASARMMYGCQTEGILLAQEPALPCSWGRGNITKAHLMRCLEHIGRHREIQVAYSLGDHTYDDDELHGYAQQLSLARSRQGERREA